MLSSEMISLKEEKMAAFVIHQTPSVPSWAKLPFPFNGLLVSDANVCSADVGLDDA